MRSYKLRIAALERELAEKTKVIDRIRAGPGQPSEASLVKELKVQLETAHKKLRENSEEAGTLRLKARLRTYANP